MQVCVFCGSSEGRDPRYRAAAEDLGRRLAGRGWGTVYGGGSAGLMGAVADAALAAGGRVHGVLPEAMAGREGAHQGLAVLDVVPDMHARKARMAELADAFVALPGGVGTLEELFEVWTWAQLGLHAKPVAVLDVAGYYRPFVELVDGMVREGFVSAASRSALLLDDDPVRLLDRLAGGRRLGPEAGDD